MATHFGGVSPVRQQQKARTLIVVAGVALAVCLVVVGVLFLSSGSTTASQKETIVKEVPAEIEMLEVLVPVQSVQAGLSLKPSMFRKERRPKQGMPARAVRDFEEIKGHYSRSLIAADAPLVLDYITNVKPSSELTASIPDGYRAVTIRVDAQSAVEGFARPGAHVDVVWSTNEERGDRVVTTIVHNAKVLSAESSTESDMENSPNGVTIPNTVTLLVTSKDAQKIQLARTAGSLSLVLRGDADVKVGETSHLSVRDLLGGADRTPQGEKIDGTIMMDGKKCKIVDGKIGDCS